MQRYIGKKFGRRVRELRDARGLTQDQLAKLLLKSVETISNFERGRTLPGLLTVAKIAATLEVEIKSLFDFRDDGDVDVKADDLHERISRLSSDDRALVGEIAELLYQSRKRHSD